MKELSWVCPNCGIENYRDSVADPRKCAYCGHNEDNWSKGMVDDEAPKGIE